MRPGWNLWKNPSALLRGSKARKSELRSLGSSDAYHFAFSWNSSAAIDHWELSGNGNIWNIFEKACFFGKRCFFVFFSDRFYRKCRKIRRCYRSLFKLPTSQFFGNLSSERASESQSLGNFGDTKNEIIMSWNLNISWISWFISGKHLSYKQKSAYVNCALILWSFASQDKNPDPRWPIVISRSMESYLEYLMCGFWSGGSSKNDF